LVYIQYFASAHGINILKVFKGIGIQPNAIAAYYFFVGILASQQIVASVMQYLFGCIINPVTAATTTDPSVAITNALIYLFVNKISQEAGIRQV
jgi:hypothetical protein